MKPIPFKVFLIGLMWAACSGLSAGFALLIAWVQTYSDPPDWNLIGKTAAGGVIFAVGAYWRKYKAQIALPPDWAEARDLVRTVTTVETVEKQLHPPTTVTTTVEQTTTGPPTR